MSPDKQENVTQRAHQIWEREGRVEGRHEEHWAQALREIESEDKAASAASGAKPTTADNPTHRSAGSENFSGAPAAGAAPPVGKAGAAPSAAGSFRPAPDAPVRPAPGGAAPSAAPKAPPASVPAQPRDAGASSADAKV